MRGQRIAQFRKAGGVTKQQLAEALGIAQQTMAHYEGMTADRGGAPTFLTRALRYGRGAARRGTE